MDSDQPTTQPLTKLKNLETGNTLKISHIDQKLTVKEVNPQICFEAELQDSDGTIYHLRETLLEDDVLEIERQSLNSEPIIVRELTVTSR